MSVPCPHCQSPLNLKEPKPGRYQPKCPKCGQQFLLVVPDDPTGTIAAKPLAVQPKTAPVKPPAPRPLPVDPNVTGAFTEVDPPAPPVKTHVFQPSGVGDPNSTGAFTEVDRAVDRTGQFDPSVANDPHSTGAFTEVDRNLDRTGQFEPSQMDDDEGPGTQRFTPSEAGDRGPGPDQTSAFTEEPAAAPKPKDKTKTVEEIPDRLGGYEVLKVLGKGGMGAVLLGRQMSLDRKVALKIMHSRLAKDPGFVARFTREAYAAAQLVHHNVIQIYDIGEQNGTHFFSMEFVPGKSLMEEVKEKGKLDAEVAVGYVLQAARGLRYGHNQGMVHRDIKPDNLMLNTEGIVKVADLGLVKLPTPEVAQPKTAELFEIDGDDDGRLTRAGVVMGTPSYMPPEQSKDSSTVDHRADIYSLGCTLYVLLTGKPPFEGKTALEVMSKHQTQPIVPPEVIVKRVPKALSGIVSKMMAKKPEDRYQSMDDLILALEAYLGLSRGGPFTPKEEHADALEKATKQFNAASKRGLKKAASLAFFAIGALAVFGLGAVGKYSWAGGVLMMLFISPVAYFVIHGVQSGSHLFKKARQWLAGSRFVDWLMWFGGSLLFLLTLWIFGVLWHTLGFAVFGIGLAYLLYSLTDGAAESEREEPLNDIKVLFKQVRLQGMDEDAIRQFACKYAGDDWEELYEALFGFDAKMTARAYRKGAVSETSRKFAAWREPIIAWFETKIRERQEDRERRHLETVQTKALEGKGVSAAQAKEEAAALADVLIEQANQARAAKQAGQPVNLRGMVQVARTRKPPAGYNIAGIKRRSGFTKTVLEGFLGRRLRLVLGAAVFALGLAWMHQNKLFDKVQATATQVADQAKTAGKALTDGDTKAAAATAGQLAQQSKTTAGTQPVRLPLVPESVREAVSHYGTPIGGFLLILTGIFYYGWRPSLVAVPGCLISVLGPTFVPVDLPVAPWLVGAGIGALLMIVVGRFLRS